MKQRLVSFNNFYYCRYKACKEDTKEASKLQ